MKFSTLKMGTEFRYKGELYQKISPVMARNLKQQNQKLIPRSTEVEVAQTEYPSPRTEPITQDQFERSFHQLQQSLSTLVNNLTIDSDVKQALGSKIEHELHKHRCALFRD